MTVPETMRAVVLTGHGGLDKLEYHEDTGIVELHINGRANGEELMEAATARIAFGKERGVERYIINVRHLEAPRSATTAVFEIPTRLYDEQGASRSSTIAVIAPIDAQSMWAANFFEDTCVNRGWRVETFLDRDRAIDWLLETLPR